jgi:hypothetical protein
MVLLIITENMTPYFVIREKSLKWLEKGSG